MAKKAAKKVAKIKAGKPTRKAARAKAKRAWPIVDEVRDLVQLMLDKGLSEISVEDGPKRISLRRGPIGLPVAEAALVAGAVPAPAVAAEAPTPTENLLEIKSPMVGTFYTTPSPDSEPYVSGGSPVADDTVVCIVEAMKVMNEIKAECVGTITEVCVKNAQPVEFGQVLFKVNPS